MFQCFYFRLPSKSKLKSENDPQTTPLIINGNDYDGELHNPTTAIALILTSWLHGRRLRYLILALCLPLLIPIVIASIPVICAVEICFRFWRHRRRLNSGPPEDVEGGGEVVAVSLLERYLDDQLGLVIEFACGCDDGGDGSG
ncbi:hypothetical protein R6Q59_005302 [Mikania micrantha]